MNKLHAFQGKILLEDISIVIEKLEESTQDGGSAVARTNLAIAKQRAANVRDILLRLLISDVAAETVAEAQIARAA